MIYDILLTVAVTLIVNEATDVSPWLAVRLVRWAAKHIYATHSDRAARHKEEWEALISDDSIPTKISKLFFGLGLACTGLYWIAIRGVPTVFETIGDLIEVVFGVFDDDEFIAGVMVAWIVIGSTSMSWLDWLIITGALFGLMFGLIGVQAICHVAADSIRSRI